MGNDVKKELAEYCHRFGKIAVDLGYVTEAQLLEAMTEQINGDLANRPHRIIGSILFEKGWMTNQQIEAVMKELFRRRGE